MSAPRAAHTSTALLDGRVLVAGGFVEERSPIGAELYLPDGERFAPLPPMVATRHSHSATRLRDGRVLIAGGYGAGSAILTAAEVFDPATSSFTRTGSMLSARADHVAVLLQDGRVLIAGGLGPDWTFLSSAEIYDPATGRFAATGAMTEPRESHVAVRLEDGRVLIAGGHRGRRERMVVAASAETYHPATGRFTPAGNMRLPRHKHDAVVLSDGRVLVSGGTDERTSDTLYRSTELFDPANGTFAFGPAMHLPRYKHEGNSVSLPNGTVLLGGGAPQAEIYDPVSGSFAIVPGAARMAGQFSAVSVLADGGALVTGGYGNGGGPRAQAWRYRP